MAAKPSYLSTEPGTAPRTGPVGRLARLLLAALLAWVGYDLLVDRTAIFAGADAGLLVLTALGGFVAHQIGALAGRGRQTLAALAVLVVAAGVVAWAGTGQLWAPPLSWLAWGLSLGFTLVVTGTLLTAVVVGTPGCEIGVLAELTRRLRRRTQRTEALFCLVGLHKLDAWEAARRRGAGAGR